MKADLEIGYPTGRAAFMAKAFGSAKMSVLERKVIEKLVNQPQQIVLGQDLTPVARFSIPEDPEIRDMQRAILAKLIPDTLSG